MFKKAIVLVLILLFVQMAFSMRLVDPVNKELVDGDFVGSVSPGSTLELIISKDYGTFDAFTVSTDLPKGFSISTKTEQESFKVYISVPSTVGLTDYSLLITVVGKSAEEKKTVFFTVAKDLITASFDNYSAKGAVGSEVEYPLTLVNNSYADEYVTIVPSLPTYWKSNGVGADFVVQKVLVPKRSTVTGSFDIYPRTQGEKIFDTTIYFGSSGESKTTSLKVIATPTLEGKIDSVRYGLPFFSFSLFPAYLLNGLIGFFF